MTYFKQIKPLWATGTLAQAAEIVKCVLNEISQGNERNLSQEQIRKNAVEVVVERLNPTVVFTECPKVLAEKIAASVIKILKMTEHLNPEQSREEAADAVFSQLESSTGDALSHISIERLRESSFRRGFYDSAAAVFQYLKNGGKQEGLEEYLESIEIWQCNLIGEPTQTNRHDWPVPPPLPVDFHDPS